MSFAFEKTPRTSLSCKLVPVLYQEYKNSFKAMETELQKYTNSRLTSLSTACTVHFLSKRNKANIDILADMNNIYCFLVSGNQTV